MLKLGKIGAAIFLSLLMSLTLLASGVFAQSVTKSHTKIPSNVATTTGSQQGMMATLQVVDTQQVTPQQANRCWWRWVYNWRWHTWHRVWTCGWGGGWWHRGWHRGGWWHGGWHGGGWHGGWHGGGWHGGGWHGGWHGGGWHGHR